MLPTHSPDGVDLTLIRWCLTLTPAERLEALESSVNDLELMREHIKRHDEVHGSTSNPDEALR
jgi:hypothetical protein